MAEIPPVIQASLKFQAQLKARDNAALKRIVRAYQQSHAALKDKIDLLLKETEGQVLTKGQLVRMSRYKELMAQVDEELQALQVLTRNEVRGGATAAVAQGARDAAQLMSYAATGGPGIAAGFNRLPVETIVQLLGFLSPDGPLYERLSKYAEINGKRVADVLVEGITLGKNPRVIAAAITRDGYGMALTDSLRMVRTVNLWSYREASRANYLANADIISGWVWYSARDDRTCEACLAMDGTVHDLSEPLEGHYNCRCTPIPLVTGFDSPVAQTGEQWFKEQPESYQRQALGRGKYEAWRDGRFEFSQLARGQENDVYGNMIVATSLKDLIGEG